ncbi:MAG: CC0125/CC1285 family lipoprotein [Rhizomicrobium sp.]
MNFKRIAIVSTFLALGACVSPTVYKAAGPDHHTGYSDQRLADNRFRVTFRGNSATLREKVEDYLLLRSAEVTREAGYSWFEFDTRSTEAKTTYQTDFAGWPGWGPGFGWYWHSWAFDPLGRVSTTVPTTSYEAYAEIILLTPEQAKGDPHSLRAEDVIARLGPTAERPPAQ